MNQQMADILKNAKQNQNVASLGKFCTLPKSNLIIFSLRILTKLPLWLVRFILGYVHFSHSKLSNKNTVVRSKSVRSKLPFRYYPNHILRKQTLNEIRQHQQRYNAIYKNFLKKYLRLYLQTKSSKIAKNVTNSGELFIKRLPYGFCQLTGQF
jgi:hypothetical protein